MKSGERGRNWRRAELFTVIVVAVWLLGNAAGCPVLAGQTTDDENMQELTIALDEAIRQALSVSADVRLAELAIAEAEIALQEAEIRQLEGRPVSELRSAQIALQQARDAYLDALVKIALEVEEAYYNVLRSRETLAIQSQAIERSDRQFAVTEARYKAGLIASQDYLEAEAAHKRQQSAQRQAQQQLVSTELRFAALLGMEEAYIDGTKLVLVGKFPYEPLKIDLEEAWEEAFANRAEIVRGRRDLKEAVKAVEVADNDYTAPVELRRAKMNKEKAEIALQKALSQVRLDVRQGWISLQNAEEKVRDARLDEELTQRRQEITRARYDAGSASLLELLTDQAAAAQAKLDAVGAVWDYNLTKARFLRQLGRSELPALPDEIQSYIDSWQDGGRE